MTELGLGVFSVWIIWQVADVFVTADRWIWWLLAMAAGVGWVCLFLDYSYWWQGLGIGGAAVFVALVADFLLLVGDAARVHVLRNTRGQ